MQNVIVFVGTSATQQHALNALASIEPDVRIVVAETAAEVISSTDRHSVVLTDLPEESGTEFLYEIAGHKSPGKFSTPIVILTSPGNELSAVQVLRDVATSYVPVRLIDGELIDTIKSVFRFANTQQNRMRIMDCVTRWHNEFVLENDSSLIGPLVRYLQESTQRMGLICEPGEETRLGIALEEALRNSMYHGNLEVSSRLREDDDSKFYELVKERQHLPPYCDRRIRVHTEFCREKAVFVIEDEGPGFDVSSVPDPTDTENIEKVCGRGMLLMRNFMDEVEYNENGNRVQLTKRRQICDPS